MPYRKFNPTVRELSPILNNSRKTGVWRLIDNFAGFAARSVKRERKYLDLLRLRHPVCQVAWTRAHVGTPNSSAPMVEQHIRSSN
jgi:hypothetical protein